MWNRILRTCSKSPASNDGKSKIENRKKPVLIELFGTRTVLVWRNYWSTKSKLELRFILFEAWKNQENEGQRNAIASEKIFRKNSIVNKMLVFSGETS